MHGGNQGKGGTKKIKTVLLDSELTKLKEDTGKKILELLEWESKASAKTKIEAGEGGEG